MGNEETRLRELYLKERLTIKEVARKMNWTYFATINKLYKYRIRKHDLMDIKLDKNKIIYLAGLFDGEGSFYIKQQKLKDRLVLKPIINIGMTCKETIETVFLWLKNAGFHPKFIKTKYKRRDKWKPFYRVRLFWMQEIKKLLELLQPYIITKRKITKLALEYLNQRTWGTSYKSKDFELANKIKNLNGGN